MRKKSLRAMKSAVFQAPESRAEAIMQNILGANNILVPPEAPFEEILQSILYNTPYTKEAEARIEDILLAIKNNGTYDGDPQSRDEEILISKLNQTPYTKDAESRIEELFILWAAQSIVKQLEGVPPLTFTAIGKPIISCSIYGNMSQSATPTPSSPVTPAECGERTAQLIPEIVQGGVNANNGNLSSSSNRVRTNFISVVAGTTYTVSGGNLMVSASAYYNNGVFVAAGIQSSGYTKTFTVPEGANQTAIGFRNLEGTDITPSDISGYMLNEGPSSLPFEPYGVKFPVQCGGVTTNWYSSEPIRKIGDNADWKSNTQEYRTIQKLVLTGEETWNIYETSSSRFFYISLSPNSIASSPTVNTHFGKNKFQITAAGNSLRLYDSVSDYANVSEWTTYLRQQYAAGTPVCVWYVLASPTTESITAPEIPTVKGENTFDVDTDLKPSNVYIEYQ